jgi:hypothetical protein
MKILSEQRNWSRTGEKLCVLEINKTIEDKISAELIKFKESG